MKIRYAGFNNTQLSSPDDDGCEDAMVVGKFAAMTIAADDIIVGWNYHLLLRDGKLYIANRNIGNGSKVPTSLELPDRSMKIKHASTGKEALTLVTETGEIWQYKIYEKNWKRVSNFCHVDHGDREYPVKVYQNNCTIALTNLGRVYNIPVLVDMPRRSRFVDVACGFDHTVMLAENGDVYTMGLGTRGQLGHGDLEDCDNPSLVEALAGLRVVQISAGGWHSAAITEEGDLYAWGWNTNGELGFPNDDAKISAIPKIVDFFDNEGRTVDVIVTKVRCGNVFTICMLDDKSMWGCGSNKYGQLGQSTRSLRSSEIFVKLKTGFDENSITDFKCDEWTTVIITSS